MPEMSPGPDPYDIQFDTVEPAPAAPNVATEPSGVMPPPVAPTAGPVCAGCKQPIYSTYFTVGNKLICPNCRQQLAGSTPPGSRVGRFAKAMIFGVCAAFVGTIVWFAVRKITGYEIGLIAIVVGVLVGGAVRAGSGGRGGWKYQLLAVLLTYLSISANYMPDLAQKFYDDYRDGGPRAASTSAATARRHKGSSDSSKTATPATPATPGSPATVPPSSPSSGQSPGIAKAIGALLLLVIILLLLACAVPILVGIQNPIGLLIMGFALWEAWKINKRKTPQAAIAGPFAVGGMAPAGAPA